MKEYIDKQEFLKELRYDLENDCNVYCDNFDRIMRDRKYEFTIDTVQDASTVEAKEVVNAKWIKKNDDICYWYECSNCGCYIPQNRYHNDWFSNWCPDCGAAMVEIETD